MSSTPNPIKELIAAFPSRKSFAEAVGVEISLVHKWAQNGRIPSGWQKNVTEAAQLSGLGHVTSDWMLAIHSQAPNQAAPLTEAN